MAPAQFVGILTVLLIPLLAVDASAGIPQPYAIPGGVTMGFVTQGPNVSINEITGEVAIAGILPLPLGLIRVDLACASSAPCTGTITGS